MSTYVTIDIECVGVWQSAFTKEFGCKMFLHGRLLFIVPFFSHGLGTFSFLYFVIVDIWLDDLSCPGLCNWSDMDWVPGTMSQHLQRQTDHSRFRLFAAERPLWTCPAHFDWFGAALLLLVPPDTGCHQTRNRIFWPRLRNTLGCLLQANVFPCSSGICLLFE